MRVLILRPEPGNAATCRAVAALGCAPVALPLFAVEPVAWDPPDPAAFDVVVMTSANAARLGGPGLGGFTDLPVYTVGEATAEAARTVGFSEVFTGPADAAALGALLSGRVLHFAGSDYKPLETTAGVTTEIVYAARPTNGAKVPAADVALIHSPRAGAALDALVAGDRSMTVIAISPAAAVACGSGWREIHIAYAPREAAMLETLASLCEARAS